MKNPSFFCFVLLLLMAGCGEDAPISTETPTPPTLISPPEAHTTASMEQYRSFLGYYVGQFIATDTIKNGSTPSNKITISIDSIRADSIFGYSVFAGRIQSFRGNFDKDKSFASVLEYGEKKDTGLFTFIIAKDGQTLAGLWKATNLNFGINQRYYGLPKRVFEYNKNLALPPNITWRALSDSDNGYGGYEELTHSVMAINASSTLLTKDQIDNMYRGDLEIIRNSIYARHGYSFKNRKIRYIFDQVDWYMPLYIDVRDKLTNIEQKNIALIKRYENHAERYYDEFGR